MKINGHFITAISISALTVVCSCLAVFSIGKNSNQNNENWLKSFSDDTLITSLSIPGSHDSGASHSIGDLSGKCQDASILEQLNIGVRFFDIRLQLRNNKLQVVHGIVDQNLDFLSVLNTFSSFLSSHQSEGLFITIKEEASAKNSSISFEEALKNEISTFEKIIKQDRNLPTTLKEIRGKVVLLSRYKDNTIGVDAYSGWIEQEDNDLNNTFNLINSPIHVQDFYKTNDLNLKKEEIVSCLDYSSLNTDVLTLNYTSCYLLDSFPPTYAASAAPSINTWFPSEISSRTNLGIIISDFVTYDLCSNIIERNSL